MSKKLAMKPGYSCVVESSRGDKLLERYLGNYTEIVPFNEAAANVDDLDVVDPIFENLPEDPVNRELVVRDLYKKWCREAYIQGYKQALIQIDKRWFSVKGRPKQYLLGCYVGDYLYVTIYKEIIVLEPGALSVVVGLPDDVLAEHGLHFSFPAPISKFPRKQYPHPNLLTKEDIESLHQNFGDESWSKLFIQAYKKAMGFSTNDEEEHALYKDELFPTRIHVYSEEAKHLERWLQKWHPSVWAEISHFTLIKQNEMVEKDKTVKLASETSPSPLDSAVKIDEYEPALKKSRTSTESSCDVLLNKDKFKDAES